ncbi:TetR/AcrR family transcriptional regulator [Shewanella livingstonensis]|uniref:TetR/AcrR family transcriptional regulator n=1 Tax=Shewanella livingstonensis TaxID=150120 RepID=A0A3G8LS63_9GAMM|nr:TetR/AcrR family transcriptional regulator [Shewanella livingstonensis]AZG72381.1 TetR/AcrR family transcriptional regulator [Shewanella livingstonensis]
MQPRKQHLIDTALGLFNQQGYHATGIDLILAQSGVSKATLYKHFRSKDELILAALQQRHQQVLTSINVKVDAAVQAGESGVLAIFDALNDWFNGERFFGCNFINASAEYADAHNPIHVFSAQHKQAIAELIRAQLPPQDADKADQIGLLIEGSIVMAHTRGIKTSALMAKNMAMLILRID